MMTFNRGAALIAGLGLLACSTLVWADTIDLTTAGSSNGAGSTAAVGGNFLVQQIAPQSTGTGVIDSFLRIAANGNEQGFNTSLSTPLDDKAGNFTRALDLSQVPIVVINGVSYRQFLLDINQNGNNLIDLNQIQIFQKNGDTDQFTGPAGTPPVIAITGATQVFEMNNTCGAGGYPASPCHDILMNYALNSGSGSGDMFLYVPNSDFNASLTNVFLYSQFGLPPGSNASNDGFEEWAVLLGNTTSCPSGQFCEPPPTPEPSSLLLLGTPGLGILILLRRRFSKKSQTV